MKLTATTSCSCCLPMLACCSPSVLLSRFLCICSRSIAAAATTIYFRFITVFSHQNIIAIYHSLLARHLSTALFSNATASHPMQLSSGTLTCGRHCPPTMPIWLLPLQVQRSTTQRVHISHTPYTPASFNAHALSSWRPFATCTTTQRITIVSVVHCVCRQCFTLSQLVACDSSAFARPDDVTLVIMRDT